MEEILGHTIILIFFILLSWVLAARDTFYKAIFTLICVGVLTLVLGVSFLVIGFERLHLEEQFKRQGVSVSGKLIAFENCKGIRCHGYNPVFVYIAYDGKPRIYTAKEHTVRSKYGKTALRKEQVEVTYLRTDPNQARVMRWHHAPFKPSIFFGGLHCLLILWIGWLVIKVLR